MIKAHYLFDKMVNALCKKYSGEEANAISYLYFNHIFNISKIDIVTKKEVNWNKEKQKLLDEHQKKLFQKTPIQYILGKVNIDNLTFVLTPDVLIPRPETEELVNLVIEQEKGNANLSILDIGTGSGYIAIALAKNIVGSNVTAWDCSAPAIKVATQNATANRLDVNFEVVDVLKKETTMPDSINIIVCNPPYIPFFEKQNMDDNVVKHEPELALFVPNDNPLIYYHTILNMVLRKPNHLSKMYFEVHSPLAKETMKVFEQHFNCQLMNDMFGKPRFLVVTIR